MGCYGMQGSNYAAGDYYRGDYYRGDPGLFGFLGKAAKGLAGIAGKVIGATPIGGVLKTGVGLVKSFGPGNAISQYPPPQVPVPGVGGMISRMLPFGESGYYPGSPYMCTPNGKRGHLNKSTYVTRGGGTSRYPQMLLVHPKGTECVGPRRMNVCNPRALRRALRRASGFAKLAKRYVAVSRKFKKGKRRARR
jgi:hypothetical protein